MFCLWHLASEFLIAGFRVASLQHSDIVPVFMFVYIFPCTSFHFLNLLFLLGLLTQFSGFFSLPYPGKLFVDQYYEQSSYSLKPLVSQ